MSGRRTLQRPFAGAGVVIGLGLMLAGVAGASVPILTPGHAYCFYFSGPASTGGMHLVAAGPSVIARGPSNYVSGTYGKPQDTVVYVDCVNRLGQPDGAAYVGLPRVVLHRANGHLHFARHVVAKDVRRLGVPRSRPLTVTVTLTGSVVTSSSSTGAIDGRLRISAPGCIPHPLSYSYTGV